MISVVETHAATRRKNAKKTRGAAKYHFFVSLRTLFAKKQWTRKVTAAVVATERPKALGMRSINSGLSKFTMTDSQTEAMMRPVCIMSNAQTAKTKILL
jgi:hypothetical protein